MHSLATLVWKWAVRITNKPCTQSYEIKSPPQIILWFRNLGIFSLQNIARLGVFMFQTSDNSQLCFYSQYSSQQLTIVSSLKHKNTQPLYIFNREYPQNSEPQNGPRSGLDYIALIQVNTHLINFFEQFGQILIQCALATESCEAKLMIQERQSPIKNKSLRSCIEVQLIIYTPGPWLLRIGLVLEFAM